MTSRNITTTSTPSTMSTPTSPWPSPGSDATIVSSTLPVITTSLPTAESGDDGLSSSTSSSSSLALLLIPLGVVLVLIALSSLIFLLVRKRRLDRLRHHLMPLYNFDPQEEGEDWESELLEEGMDHRQAASRKNGQHQPKLSFSRDSDPY